MNPQALTPTLRVLRGCLHLLVVALLVLVTVRAVTNDLPQVGAVAVVAALLAVVYALGPAVPKVSHSITAAAVWLGVVGAVWTVLLILTPEAVWLAFPLFFVQLHLLPTRWGLVAVLVTTAIAIGGTIAAQGLLTAGVIIGPALGAAVAIATVLGYEALYRESEHRRRLIDELTATRDELSAAERTAGVLAERERLAREIHDTLAQGLSSIQLLLRAAERTLDGSESPALPHVQRARRAAADNLAEARRFVQDWSPPDLESGSLSTALERLCANTGETSGMVVHRTVSGTPAPLTTAQETALLRIAQSALANTVRHANATRVELTLSYMDIEVALDIVDNGTGFDPETVARPGDAPDGRGFGLAAMRARARALNGSLAVESAHGHGTAVAVTLPCQPAGTPSAVEVQP